MRDDAFGGIFDRHHAVIRAVFADLGENVGDGFLRRITQAGAELADGRLMREGRLRAEIGDDHRLLERQRAGHDFAVDGAQLLVGHRPLVQLADALQHGAFAVRRVNLLAGLELHGADGQHVFRALIEQPDDARVQLVNRLAMFGNVHSPGRMQNQTGRIKSVSLAKIPNSERTIGFLTGKQFVRKFALPNFEIQFAVRAFDRIHLPPVPCCTYPFDWIMLVVEDLLQFCVAQTHNAIIAANQHKKYPVKIRFQ